MNGKISPPKAEKSSKELCIHGDKRIDNYYWLRERDNPKVIDHLKKENEYTKAMLSHRDSLEKGLFEEIKKRMENEDQSVPYKYNGYWYFSRYDKDKEHPIYVRKKEHLDNPDEILFDLNVLATSHPYYDLNFKISPDNKIVAFSVDTLGNRIYTIYFRNLENNTLLKDTLEKVSGNLIWAEDNQHVFYTKLDPSIRSYQVFRHLLGDDPKNDVLIFEEKDELYSLYLSKTKSGKYLMMHSGSTNTDEFRILESNNPRGKWRIFEKRQTNIEYSIEHLGDFFYIHTNKDHAVNFKVMKTPVEKTQKENWVDFIAHREDYLIEGFELFKDYFLLEQRYKGLTELIIKSWDFKEAYKIDFKEETYEAHLHINKEIDTPIVRYYYSSLTTPDSVIDFNMKTKQKELKKQKKIPDGSFKKEDYIAERLWAPSRDGKKIPISLVYHKKTKKSANTPLLLYGYGAYGITVDPHFSVARLSLLNRGFIFAIAHIRGEEYLGRSWYEQGKMMHKKNTFYDFIDVASFLIEKNYSSSKHLYGMGGSAGGLLMGAVANMAPDLFHGLIAVVPFVDTLTTMLDASLPLTVGEYEEWGDPNQKKYYDYIKSYSPYDNVQEKSYPHLLVTAGLHDSQVAYWEPAKWVAKLRELKKDHHKILFHINMETGHSGSSGRFDAIKETALIWNFLLDLEHINH